MTGVGQGRERVAAWGNSVPTASGRCDVQDVIPVVGFIVERSAVILQQERQRSVSERKLKHSKIGN